MTGRTFWRAALIACAGALAATQADAGVNEWTPSGPDGGFVSGVTWHPTRPGVAFATFGFRVHRTTDGGLHWTPVSDETEGYVQGPVVVDPTNPDRIYAPAFAPLRSDDGGATFLRTNALPGNPQTAELAFAPGGAALYASGSCTVHRSVDLGRTWTSISSGLPACVNEVINDLQVDAAHPGTLYVAFWNAGLYKTIDDGAHWFPIGPAPGHAFVIAQNPFDAAELLLVQDASLWRSTDAGGTWSLAKSGYFSRVTFDPLTPGRVLSTIDGTDYLWRSANGGATWAKGPWIGDGGSSRVDASFSPHTAGTVLIASSRGVWLSTDGGVTVSPRNAGARGGTPRAFAAAGSELYVSVTSGPDIVLRRSGSGWAATNTDELRLAVGFPGALSLAAHPSNPYVVYAGGSALAKSIDGGAHWFSPTLALSPYYLMSLAIDAVDPQTLYVVASDIGVHRSRDGGVTWIAKNNGLPMSSGKYIGSKIRANPRKADELFVVMNTPNGLYRSTDAGLSWGPVSTPLSFIDDVTFDANDPAVLYVTGSPSAYRSGDGGATWTKLALDDLNLGSITVDPDVSTNVFASSSRQYGGTWRSVDGGLAWELIAAGSVPQSPLSMLTFDPKGSKRIFASEFYRGITEIELATDLVLSVAGASGDWRSGEAKTVEYTVQNLGPLAASEVVLALTLPPGWSAASLVPGKGTCSVGPGPLRCALGALARTAKVSVKMALRPAASATLVATVSAHESEITAPDNSLATPVTAKIATNLQMSITDAPATLMLGQESSLSLLVTNSGDGAAPDVQLDLRTVNLLIASAVPAAGTCTVAAGGTTCALGAMPAGSSRTVTIKGIPQATGQTSLTGTVLSGAIDTQAGDDSASRSWVTATASTGASPSGAAGTGGGGGGSMETLSLAALALLLARARKRRMAAR